MKHKTTTPQVASLVQHLLHLQHPLSDNIFCKIEVREKAKINSIEAMLLKSLLCWVRHISRMGNHCLPRATSFLLAIMTDAQQRSDSWTTWKIPLVPVISTIIIGLLKLRTVSSGLSLTTTLSLIFKIPAGPPLKIAQSVGAIEYTDCFHTGGWDSPMNILYMTQNNLMVRFQYCWNLGEYRLPLHCHRSQVHSGPKWQHLIGFYQWV